ncbi:hypothetical protein VTN02DRAFT_177 [Thermoascus thermophilus]
MKSKPSSPFKREVALICPSCAWPPCRGLILLAPKKALTSLPVASTQEAPPVVPPEHARIPLQRHLPDVAYCLREGSTHVPD